MNRNHISDDHAFEGLTRVVKTFPVLLLFAIFSPYFFESYIAELYLDWLFYILIITLIPVGYAVTNYLGNTNSNVLLNSRVYIWLLFFSLGANVIEVHRASVANHAMKVDIRPFNWSDGKPFEDLHNPEVSEESKINFAQEVFYSTGASISYITENKTYKQFKPSESDFKVLDEQFEKERYLADLHDSVSERLFDIFTFTIVQLISFLLLMEISNFLMRRLNKRGT